MNKPPFGTMMCATPATSVKLVLFAISLLASAPPCQADDLTYTTNNGTITVTGYTGSGGEVVIPETIHGLTVTTIGRQAFYHEEEVTRVSLPSSLLSIEYQAFYQSGLSGPLTLPAGVTNIAGYAFYSCDNLTGSVAIPASVTILNKSSFRNCFGITNFAVAAENPNYMDVEGVLYDKDLTTLMSCPGGKTGEHTIPEGVTKIESLSCYYCGELSGTLTVPSTVTDIGSSAFVGCARLAAFAVAEENTEYASVDGVLFDKDITTLIQCPGNKTGEYTFPAGVTKIEGSAFRNCAALTGSIIIPEGVTDIGSYAFRSCTGLTGTVEIPASVDDIGSYAFRGCTQLTAINVADGNPVYSSVDGVLIEEGDTLFQCPDGKTGAFAMPDAISDIKDYAIYYCPGLTGTLTIPEGVDSISKLIKGCSGLTAVELPTTVTYIYASYFTGCDSLESITVADGHSSRSSDSEGVLFNADQTTLVFCPSGKTGAYTVPASTTAVETGAFGLCYNLTDINVEFGSESFWSHDGLLYEGEDNSLLQCPGGKSGLCSIPEGVAALGDYCFAGCRALTAVSIPASVTQLGNSMFHDCDGGPAGLYFHGAPPAVGSFVEGVAPTVFYDPESDGWDSPFAGLATAPWAPRVENMKLESEAMGFDLIGTNGCMVIVKARDELTDGSWTPISTNIIDGTTAHFSDPDANSDKGFYRLVMP